MVLARKWVASPLDGMYPVFVAYTRDEYDEIRRWLTLSPTMKRKIWHRVPALSAGEFPRDPQKRLAVWRDVIRVLASLDALPDPSWRMMR